MVLQFIGTHTLGLMLIRDAQIKREIRVRRDQNKQLNSEILITVPDRQRR